MCDPIFQILRSRLLANAGVADGCMPDPEELRRTEWSSRFERLMRNRLVMGSYRYGTIRQRRRGHISYDHIGSAISRLRRYLMDGNQEHLADAANLCLLELEIPCCHPSPSLRSVDDGEHTRRL